MPWLLPITIVVLLGLALDRSTKRPPAERHPPLSAPPLDVETPDELALRDPVEALTLYGTDDDARRLADGGADLAGLGYRAPDETRGR